MKIFFPLTLVWGTIYFLIIIRGVGGNMDSPFSVLTITRGGGRGLKSLTKNEEFKISIKTIS